MPSFSAQPRSQGTVNALDQNVVRDARRGAFLALSLALAIGVTASIKRATVTVTTPKPLQTTVSVIQWEKVPINIGGWVVVAVFVFVMTDISEVAVLGQAFAWLIFVASLFRNGPDALAFIESQTGTKVTPHNVLDKKGG